MQIRGVMHNHYNHFNINRDYFALPKGLLDKIEAGFHVEGTSNL